MRPSTEDPGAGASWWGAVGLALAVADWATEAVGKDGKIDAADLPGLLPRLMSEMQQ